MAGISLSLSAVSEHVCEHRQRVAALDLSRSDGDLKLHVGRWIARECDDPLANCFGDFAEVSRGADRPGAECRVIVGEKPLDETTVRANRCR